MKYDPEIHNRKSIRLKGYDYSQMGLYFITVCCQNRECLFGNIDNGKMILNDAGEMVENEWLKLSQRFNNIKLHEFITMPNHFHGIINRRGEPCVRPIQTLEQTTGEHEGEHEGEHKVRPYGTLNGTVGRVIQAYKSITTVEYIRGVKNNEWQRFDGKLWQRNYWEHIICNENEYGRISEYIVNNPMKWDTDKLNNGDGNMVMEPQSQYTVGANLVFARNGYQRKAGQPVNSIS